MGIGVAQVDLNGTFIAGQGFPVALKTPENKALADIGICITRIEPNSMFKAGKRFLIVCQGTEDEPLASMAAPFSLKRIFPGLRSPCTMSCW